MTVASASRAREALPTLAVVAALVATRAGTSFASEPRLSIEPGARVMWLFLTPH